MHVIVKLHATLRKYLPPGSADNTVRLDMPEHATVADMLAQAGIPLEHAKMMVSNGERLEPQSVLRDGQEVNLFPPLAGGA